MNLGQPKVDSLLERKVSLQNDRLAFERGWINPNYFIIPQFSINGRTIGKNDSFSDVPEKDIPIWYAPLFPNSIVSVPEIGEIVAVLRETTSDESRGYWIGRINDTDDITLHLAKSQLPLNQTPQTW